MTFIDDPYTVIEPLYYLLPPLSIMAGGACLIWGLKHLRKQRVKSKRPSIYAVKPVAKRSFLDDAKAQVKFGWDAGRAAAEKRGQEKK